MPEINPDFARITCGCGAEFQVLNEDGTDWDESETASLYYAHWDDCPGPSEPPPEEQPLQAKRTRKKAS